MKINPSKVNLLVGILGMVLVVGIIYTTLQPGKDDRPLNDIRPSSQAAVDLKNGQAVVYFHIGMSQYTSHSYPLGVDSKDLDFFLEKTKGLKGVAISRNSSSEVDEKAGQYNNAILAALTAQQPDTGTPPL